MLSSSPTHTISMKSVFLLNKEKEKEKDKKENDMQKTTTKKR